MGLVISISAEPVFQLGEFIITNSVLSTLVITLSFCILAVVFHSKTLTLIPKPFSLQNIFEFISEMFLNFYATVLGAKLAKVFFPVLTTIFFFILFSNWSGLIPGVGPIGVWGGHGEEKELIPLFRAPTADLNTTLALSLIAFFMVQYQGFATLKERYLHKFFVNPFSGGMAPIFTFVGLLELLGEFTKVVSFTFRLFGNIFAGEVLLSVMSYLFPIFLSVPFLGLEIFVGLVQSLVFVMLIMVFTSIAVAESH